MDNETTPKTPRFTRNRLFAIVGLASLVALFVLPSAFARGGMGHGFGGHGCDKDQTAEQVQDKAERVLGHVLNRVDATEEQRAEALVLVEGVGERFIAHRAEHEDVRAQWQEALTAETIDEKQLESLRADMVERVDDGSEEILGLVADLASILSPEQRVELSETWQRWH